MKNDDTILVNTAVNRIYKTPVRNKKAILQVCFGSVVVLRFKLKSRNIYETIAVNRLTDEMISLTGTFALPRLTRVTDRHF